MQLKRKNIKTVALGDKFSLALGKDVPLASLRKKQAAKARRQAAMDAKANAQHNTSQEFIDDRPPRHIQSQENHPLRGQHNTQAVTATEMQLQPGGEASARSHRRLHSMHEGRTGAGIHARERATFGSIDENRFE